MFPFFQATLIPFKVHRRQKSSVDSQTTISNLELCTIRFPTWFSQIAFPTTVLQVDDHTVFFQEERLGSSILDQDLGYLCRGRRIQTSADSELGIFDGPGAPSLSTWVYADTASTACPAHPSSLAVTSITSAAVICDADTPRINTS